MNYKEKYNKVIEKIQRLLDDAKNNRHIIVRVEDIEKTFPELREFEDERIRKAISQCVEDMRGQFEKLYNVHHKDALAWLEKEILF